MGARRDLREYLANGSNRANFADRWPGARFGGLARPAVRFGSHAGCRRSQWHRLRRARQPAIRHRKALAQAVRNQTSPENLGSENFCAKNSRQSRERITFETLIASGPSAWNKAKPWGTLAAPARRRPAAGLRSRRAA